MDSLEGPDANSGLKSSDSTQTLTEAVPSNSPPDIKSVTFESNMLPSHSALPNLSNHLIQGAPLLLLIIFNLIYTHTTSIILFVGLLLVFNWSNSIVERQSILQNRRSIRSLLLLIIFLFVNCVLLIPMVNKLWLFNLTSLMTWMSFVPSFWNSLFNIALMDFIIKFFTLIVKSCLIILPTSFLPTHKQSALFFLMEAISQLLRCFLPIPEWIKYILTSSTCVSIFVCTFVATIYSVIKLLSLKPKLDLLIHGWKSSRHPQVVGASLVDENNTGSLKVCPICREKCNSPVKLSCNHIFCHSCCQVWFNWDKHCPVCSNEHVNALVMGTRPVIQSLVQVSSTNSQWKRATTDYMIQLF